MSLDLPAHPNLEHLKKQAKDRLRELQRRNPASKLADAQHAIARKYGFPGWPQLKAHVESLPRPSERQASPAEQSQGNGVGGGGAVNANDGPPPNYGFERYTERAKRATFLSRNEASQLGSPSIEPEHLLLGLMNARQGLTSRIFASALLSLGHLRTDVGTRTVVREPLSRSVVIPFSAETKRIFLRAVEEADRLQHHDIGTAHLLLGILRDEGSVAASALKEKGLSLQIVRDDIVDLLNEEPV